MKIIVCVVSLLVIVFCSSCTEHVSSHPISLSVETPTSTNAKKTAYESTYIYPSSIDLTYKAGMTMDEWVTQDDTDIVGHKKGDLFSFVIHNGENVEMQYSISIEIPSSKSWSERLQKSFAPAPKELVNWVKLGQTKINLKPTELVRVPFQIVIPETYKGDYPMEFDILVTNNEVYKQINGASIATAGKIRVFMEHN